MRAKVIRYVLTLLLILAAGGVYAQSTALHIVPVDKDAVFVQQLKVKTQFSSPTLCMEYVQQLPGLLQAKGYMAASIDTLYQKDSSTIAVHLFTGDAYTWKQLQVNASDWPLLQMAGIDKAAFEAKPFQPAQALLLQEQLLDYLENNGYPFAAIQYDSIRLDGNQVTAKVIVNKGILYRMDSLRIIGAAKVNKSFLYHYLDMQPGTPYSREKLERINQRLQELPFLQPQKGWDLTMLGGSYLLNLYLQPQRSNQVDAIVGFLPANQQLGGKLLFTVDAKLKLQNAFASGESISLNWQQIQPQSPKLDIAFQRPYIFNSNFGLDFSFNLFKRDSSFINVSAGIGLLYALSTRQTAKVTLQTFSTSLLNVDTNAIKTSKVLPTEIDFSVLSLGVEYELNNTNYRFNPRKGNEIKFTLTAGNKRIRKNNTITQLKETGFDYNSLYDGLTLNTYQVKARLYAAQYFPLGRQSVFKTGINAGLLQSQNYFRNELFQIGGYRLLRGFDEESIFSNRYAVATLEYRYLLAQNSNFFTFTDVGFSHNSVTAISNSFIGGGFGLAFQTKQGIFNISYAAGKRNDLPFSLRQSKIHIGFVSLF